MTGTPNAGDTQHPNGTRNGHENSFREEAPENLNSSTIAEVYSNRIYLGFANSGQNPRVAPTLNADNAAMMSTQSIADLIAIQQAVNNLPFYDGNNLPFRDFIQYIVNASSYVTPNCETALTTAIITKLSESARDCTRNKQFNKLIDLVELLKERFAPGKPLESYIKMIIDLRMYRNESVNELYDRIQGYLSGARSAAQDKYGEALTQPTMTIMQEI